MRAELQAQKAEIEMLHAEQAVAAAAPPPLQPALLTVLAGIVDPSQLQALPEQLATVPQHMQAHYALEWLNSTGALNFNRPYSLINTIHTYIHTYIHYKFIVHTKKQQRQHSRPHVMNTHGIEQKMKMKRRY